MCTPNILLLYKRYVDTICEDNLMALYRPSNIREIYYFGGIGIRNSVNFTGFGLVLVNLHTETKLLLLAVSQYGKLCTKFYSNKAFFRQFFLYSCYSLYETAHVLIKIGIIQKKRAGRMFQALCCSVCCYLLLSFPFPVNLASVFKEAARLVCD